MSTTPRPHGQVTHARSTVNARIRRLMNEPATRSRTDRYTRLLAEWEEATRGDERECTV